LCGSALFPAEQDWLVLGAARHVHDLAGRETDPAAQGEQKIGVVGDGGFRLSFRLDERVALISSFHDTS